MGKTIWDNPSALSQLEEMRRQNRMVRGRITFDCLNLKLDKGGGRVYCKHKRLRSASLLAVLKGTLYSACIDCPYFEQENKR
jgi:hypothetical protein